MYLNMIARKRHTMPWSVSKVSQVFLIRENCSNILSLVPPGAEGPWKCTCDTYTQFVRVKETSKVLNVTDGGWLELKGWVGDAQDVQRYALDLILELTLDHLMKCSKDRMIVCRKVKYSEVVCNVQSYRPRPFKVGRRGSTGPDWAGQATTTPSTTLLQVDVT